jgi:predicted ATPase/DNA-binding CsgD family transcriptional regulator
MGERSAPVAPPRRAASLPVPLTSLIGREREITVVRDLLLRDDVRLLTIIGPPGVGKTRLALAVAAAASADFPDGVWFVPLATATDPGLVLPTIAATLDLPGSTHETPSDRLSRYLADEHALLVLDNLEHVLAAAPEVSALLVSCPWLRVLATSRAALRLSGEQQFPVSPLALPPAAEALPASRLVQFAAVRLFVERARLVVPGFILAEQDAAAVAETCRRLDGLPLAIELAAAQIKLFPPLALMARLTHLLPALTGGPRDAPVRQQTLRAALDWSHDLLTTEEQIVFRRFSVFNGGCTLEAAEAVCADPAGASHVGVAASIASLLDKSLLQREGVAGQPRLSMLRSVHEYAQEWLDASGEAKEVGRQHATYYLALAPVSRPLSPLTSRAVRAGIDELEVDLGNYRRAMAWFLAQGEGESALRLALILYPIWEEQGRLDEGAGWLERALETGPPSPDLLRAQGMALLAALAGGQGDRARADRLQQQCLRIYRQRGDLPRIAATLTALGAGARSWNDFAVSRRYLEESLDILSRLGHRGEIARCLSWLGAAARGEGQYARARAYLQDSLDLARRIARGEFSADQDAGEEVVPFRCIETEIWCLWNLGAVACDEGDYEAARGYFHDQLTLNESWDPNSLAAALLQVARVALLAGQADRAARLLACADALRTASRYPWPPVDHPDREAVQTVLRAVLSAEVREHAAREGATMTLTEALDYAFETLATPPTDALRPTDDGDPRSAASPRSDSLSTRQLEVARLVARGHSNRQIAEALTITERTAENHVEHIMQKLGFHSRAQIAAWAAQRMSPPHDVAPPHREPAPARTLSPA